MTTPVKPMMNMERKVTEKEPSNLDLCGLGDFVTEAVEEFEGVEEATDDDDAVAVVTVVDEGIPVMTTSVFPLSLKRAVVKLVPSEVRTGSMADTDTIVRMIKVVKTCWRVAMTS